MQLKKSISVFLAGITAIVASFSVMPVEAGAISGSVTYDSDVVDTLLPNASMDNEWEHSIFEKSWFLGDSGLTEEDYITISIKQPYTVKGKLYYSAYIVDIYQDDYILSSALMNVEIKDGVPIKIKDILSSGGEYTNGKAVNGKFSLNEVRTLSFEVWDISEYGYNTLDYSITLSAAESISGDSNAEVEKPTMPSSLKAIPKTTTSVKLSWKDNDADSYNIYRATSKNGTYKKIASTEKTTYTNKSLTKGKTYYYKVTAVTDGVESEFSKVVSAKATSPTPSSVKVSKAKDGTAKLTWKKSTGAKGYEIYMAKSSDGKYTKIKSVSNKKLTYLKSGLTKGKTYYFKVRSYAVSDGKKIYSPYSKVVKVKM